MATKAITEIAKRQSPADNFRPKYAGVGRMCIETAIDRSVTLLTDRPKESVPLLDTRSISCYGHAAIRNIMS